MFTENILYKQIIIKTILAPLESTLTTANYVKNICASIPKNKRVYQSGSVTRITFLCARALHISLKSCTLTRIFS